MRQPEEEEAETWPAGGRAKGEEEEKTSQPKEEPEVSVVKKQP